jgi:lysophospholipase L1-like esterase
LLFSTLFRSAAVATAALAVGAGAATPAQAAPINHIIEYVALGDSYAAGLGATRALNACGQTDRGYPFLWAHAVPAAVSMRLSACAGATAHDVSQFQLARLSRTTDLVSVTVGANDLNVFGVLRSCMDPRGVVACAAGNGAIEQALTTTLRPDVRRMLRAVTTAAPHANVVLTGYPLPFENTANCPGVDVPRDLRTRADNVIARLNALLADQARRSRVRFADVARDFAGHGLCSSRPWLIGEEGLRDRTVLHPTATGQARGYLPSFSTQALRH